MKNITDAKVFASQGKHHWYLALDYHELAQKHRIHAAAYQKRADAHLSKKELKELLEELARRSTLLAQNYQLLAEQSLATSKLYFRFLQTKYGDALVTEFALLTPVSDTLRYLS